jgi:hypothetical protein
VKEARGKAHRYLNSIPSRMKRQSKGPEAGEYLGCLSNRKETSGIDTKHTGRKEETRSLGKVPGWGRNFHIGLCRAKGQYH